jgi:hypothetical protein
VSSSRCRAGVNLGVLLSLGLVLGGSVLAGCSSAATSSETKPKPGVPATGSDPVAWTGAFCTGLGDVIKGISAIAKSQATPQGQKDGLLEFSDIAQRAFANTAVKLEQLGPPKITDGTRLQDTAVGFFRTAAGTVSDQRAKLAALDAKDPEFVQKASHLAGPDLSGASAQMQGLTSNPELAPAFRAAPECKSLSPDTKGK